MKILRRILASSLPPAVIDGVPVRQSVRARRLALRFVADAGQVMLVWPQSRRVTARSLAAAARFIADHQSWIARQNAAHARSVLRDGDVFFLAGEKTVLRHLGGRGVTGIVGGELRVTGDARHFASRAQRFFKARAADAFLPVLREKESRLGLAPARLIVRDPKTRWGSCSSTAQVMLSWRLLLAPPAVMDYVIAHEVAHRRHMNHGRQFWALCHDLAEDAVFARRWLKKEGAGLLSLRLESPTGS
jgi:hypothetical protein